MIQLFYIKQFFEFKMFLLKSIFLFFLLLIFKYNFLISEILDRFLSLIKKKNVLNDNIRLLSNIYLFDCSKRVFIILKKIIFMKLFIDSIFILSINDILSFI